MNELLRSELDNLDSVEETTKDGTTESFFISDLETANWAFRKLRAYKERIEEKKKLAEEEISRVEMWLKSETQKDEQSVQYFENLLIRYYQNERLADKKFRLSTPHGQVTSRKRQPKVEVKDEDAIKYLKETNPELVKVEEKYDKRELKKMYNLVEIENELKAVTEDGEMLEFIKAEPQADSYTVKVD